MARTKQTKGAPTALNIFALADVAAKNALQPDRTFRNAVHAVDAPHLRRCLKAGLIEVADRATLRLTDAGVAAVLPEMKDRLARALRPNPHGYARTDREQADINNFTAAVAALEGNR